jgi:hypothetical protein
VKEAPHIELQDVVEELGKTLGPYEILGIENLKNVGIS